ncbi:MAG TPA: methyltransferase domain-containing protein [Prochlorococcaceae cyanobacterium AMR_MDS_5431]|nr:methyltransferase domain-containing protein [Prochlorococcaceae cyanobacterium AMR_MDS_5431]
MLLTTLTPAALSILTFFLFFVTLLYLLNRSSRRYENKNSVAKAYDDWTEDQLLERLWGEHVHLGYYGETTERCDFRVAKEIFVHQLVHWSGLDQLPHGSTVLDVGCGIGGSSRILARDYGFNVLGISISPSQVKRARELTNSNSQCQFAVMDALDLKLADGSFDAIWSVEAGPHMPDKQLYADEIQRILQPNGLLIVADWNSRDQRFQQLNKIERWVMRQLLDQWAHPEFASISGFRDNLQKSKYNKGLVDTDDWTMYTLPSWFDSITEGLRRPFAILTLGPVAITQGLREIPTLLMMHWAFSRRMMQFGVFRARSDAFQDN